MRYQPRWTLVLLTSVFALFSQCSNAWSPVKLWSRFSGTDGSVHLIWQERLMRCGLRGITLKQKSCNSKCWNDYVVRFTNLSSVADGKTFEPWILPNFNALFKQFCSDLKGVNLVKYLRRWGKSCLIRPAINRKYPLIWSWILKLLQTGDRKRAGFFAIS